MRAPTPIRALVHSSTLVIAGLLLIPKTEDFLVAILIIMALGTMAIASLVALSEIDLKKIVALSTMRPIRTVFLSY